MNYAMIVLWIFAIIGILICIKILYRSVDFVNQYFVTKELDLVQRYGSNKWVLITGPSSGMGRQFAYEFADRGFNLLLIGSKKTNKVIKTINTRCPNVEVIYIEADFSESFKDDFFDPIQKIVDDLGDKWSILINNVGYRTACIDYREMDINEMKKTISVGTLVQSKLTQMAIQKFASRTTNTAIVSITAQNSICTDLFALENDLTVPHLACYEASNVFGYCHAKSVYAEIKDVYPLIDFLIVTPGAVKTENTKKVLDKTIFAVDVETYVKNIMKLLGNYNGPRCAYWGHSLSPAFLNIFPFVPRESIVKKVGSDFAKSFKKRPKSQINRR